MRLRFEVHRAKLFSFGFVHGSWPVTGQLKATRNFKADDDDDAGYRTSTVEAGRLVSGGAPVFPFGICKCSAYFLVCACCCWFSDMLLTKEYRLHRRVWPQHD